MRPFLVVVQMVLALTVMQDVLIVQMGGLSFLSVRTGKLLFFLVVLVARTAVLAGVPTERVSNERA